MPTMDSERDFEDLDSNLEADAMFGIVLDRLGFIPFEGITHLRYGLSVGSQAE
jgi:hypothetical protein